MRLVARRQQVGGDITLGGDIGDDLDLLVDLGKTGEELGIGIAFQHGAGDRVAGGERGLQPVLVGLVQEDLGLQHLGGFGRGCGVIAKREVEKHADRRPAFHVREQLEGEGARDFRNHGLAKDDLFQEGGLLAGGAGGAGKRVVDEEIERCGAMRVAGILDLRDELLHQPAIIDRLRLQPLFLAVFDLFQIGVIQRHFVPHEKFSAALRCRTGRMRGPGMKSRPAVPRRIVSGLPTTSPLRQARRPGRPVPARIYGICHPFDGRASLRSASRRSPCI